jgi:hypothetical protein
MVFLSLPIIKRTVKDFRLSDKNCQEILPQNRENPAAKAQAKLLALLLALACAR